MSVPQPAIDIVKRFEGLRLKPYLCSAGVPTIGYGSTRYEDGTPAKLTDPPITLERAEALLSHGLTATLTRVRGASRNPPVSPLCALVSFAYNLGVGALKGSTLLRKHNAGDYEGAAKEFGRWVNAGGKPTRGLILRRQAERELYES